MSHNGYIYQATNWVYTGLTEKRKERKNLNDPNKHSRRVSKFNGVLVQRSQKHRYVFFIGNKKEKKVMLKDFKYENLDYPKGNNKNYECIDIDMKIQPELFSF